MRPVPAAQIGAARAEAYRRQGLWGRPPVAQRLEDHAGEAPHRLALVDGFGARLTYGQLAAAVRAAAAHLLGEGVGPGDAVALALPNCADYVIAHLAASRIGAISVLLSAREGPRDIAYAVEATEARLVLLAPGPRLDDTVAQLAGSPARVFVADPGSPDAAGGPVVGGPRRWPGHLTLTEPADPVELFRPGGGEPEIVVFTSGTTGRPKGIAHTYDGTGASLAGWQRALGITWKDSVFCPATFGHVGGTQWGLRTAVHAGAPLVVMDRWDAAGAAELIQAYGCTYTLVTPTYIIDLLALPPAERAKTDGFRMWTVGGSRMAPSLVDEAEAKLGGQLLRGFGMSECFMVTVARPDDPVEARRSSDGRALPGCDVAVWDDDGRPVPDGVPGDLVVRGPSLVGGYFTDPVESARTFVDGWQRTGDVVVRDAGGFMSVVDRKKELIIRGGENVSPQELEQALATYEGLPPLAVVAVPDDRLGERVAVVYEGQPGHLTLEDLHRHLGERGLARYKWPELVTATAELPRTALGKLQRGEVRRLAAGLLDATRRSSST